MRCLLLLPLSACAFVSDSDVQWRTDPDGDGVSIEEDCDSQDASIGAPSLWFIDLDGDGYGDPNNTVESCSQPEGGVRNGDDCWDDPDAIPADFIALNGLPQPEASAVYPGASNALYDGVNQSCAESFSDFDGDGDGFTSAWYADRDGTYGDDCIDGSPLDADNLAGLDPAAVNPDAVEVWYDGTDADCDSNDCDADGDGYDGGASSAYCEASDCDDTDSSVSPDGSIAEIYYNGIDDNCDISVGDGDGDADGDGYWSVDYDALVESGGGEPLEVPEGYAGDCWDDPATTPTDMVAINGYSQPAAADVHPAASEAYYDDVDQDCAGDSDFDADGDGYDYLFLADRTGQAGDDCYDSVDQPDAFDNLAGLQPGEVNPGAAENYYDGTDANCDGNDDDQDEDGYAGGGGEDCDDYDSTINPGATEIIGDEVDSDCDGGELCYVDTDDDGYRPDATSSIVSVDTDCTDSGEATASDATGDCDDELATAYPGAVEICDGADSDCDGTESDDGLITLDDTTNHTTIQAAIDAASSGSIITVCVGTFSESLTSSSDLTIRSLFGSDTATIDADASGPAITVASGDLTLLGLTLTGGIGADHPDKTGELVGGGLAILGASAVSLSDVVISDSLADLGGGIYAASAASLDLESVLITSNEATDGGGIYLDNADAQADLDTAITANSASSGGGLWMSLSSWQGGSFTDNDATDGGGVYADSDNTLTGSTLQDNIASSSGGGLVALDGSLSTSRLSLTGNEALYGGGMYLLAAALTDDGTSSASSNSATDGGGFYSADACTIEAFIFSSNSASEHGGGGVLGDSSLTLTDAILINNEATSGGGVYVYDGTLTSDASDWGGELDANTPDDVSLASSSTTYDYEGVASFSCTSGSCK